jgi:hypothetical protein
MQPIVIRPRHGGGQPRVHVRNGQGEETARGIDHRDVNPLHVHRFQLHLGGPATLLEGTPAFLIAGEVVPLATAVRVGVVRHPPPRLAVVCQAEVSEKLCDAQRRPIPKCRIDVAWPQIRRLDDVDVAVEDFEMIVCHGISPSGLEAC